jgi:hypothetical protein
LRPRQEGFGVLAMKRVRHAGGHPRDIEIVGQLGDPVAVRPPRRAQRQPPRLDAGCLFDPGVHANLPNPPHS